MPQHLATSPDHHVAVHAAAGTGKTTLLVDRVVRLLGDGTDPSAILAITFTRKAAGEIAERVSQRLFDLTSAGEEELSAYLQRIGAAHDAAGRAAARNLFERVLTAERPIQATTFHAFCQELLRRFPFEAGVPPGFELLEDTSDAELEAWNRLRAELTADPTGALGRAMDVLLSACRGVDALQQSMEAFLRQRSDWWAYTEDDEDPVAAAGARLARELGVGDGEAPAESCVDDPALAADLRAFQAQLARLSRAGAAAHSAAIDTALSARADTGTRYAALREVFFTQTGAPRSFRIPADFTKRYGEAERDAFQDLHDRIEQRLVQVESRRLAQRAYAVTLAWYRCGTRLLEHYAAVKRGRGAVDFADLEWGAYRLLNHGTDPQWIQFRLDQRIEHVLIDEFQDTNPTQWRMLVPLLSEIVAGDPERTRSVFLVGDVKQSLYGFRRANPALFPRAVQWLRDHASVEAIVQDKSWRFSPAVTQLVNLVFAGGGDLQDFIEHDTHRPELWGRVQLLPLVVDAEERVDDSAAALRNPLLEPRRVAEDERYRREAALVTDAIHGLLGSAVMDADGPRPLAYGDIMLLLRDRTHAAVYEEALQRAGIPYEGAGRGTLLDCMEVRDLLALLRVLVAPFDDLALATVLRCPLFSCSDEDLLRLARHDEQRPWRLRLDEIGAAEPPGQALHRAARLIGRWSVLADRVPAHDLLDRILCEGDVIDRYAAAVPPHLAERTRANLTRLLELALELDSGRYPSLSRLLDRMLASGRAAGTAPDEPAVGRGQRVRVMTIHAAKGLEAPAVFLVDAARPPRSGRAYEAVIDWPAEADRPRAFRLLTRREDVDPALDALLSQQNRERDREQANLLYVALTRARQYLFISGCEPRRGDAGWYALLRERLEAATGQVPGLTVHGSGDALEAVIESGSTPECDGVPAQRGDFVEMDPALQRALNASPDAGPVAPSRSGDAEPPQPPTARARGELIHRMLDALTRGDARAAVRDALREQTMGTALAPLFDVAWDEACRTLDAPALRALTAPGASARAFNELPLIYRDGEREVSGVVDRLLVFDDRLCIVDYKTRQDATPDNAARLAAEHAVQLRLYADGARRLFPRRKVEAYVVFTACAQAVAVEV